MEKVIYSKSFTDFLKNSECKLASVLYMLSQKNYTPICLTTKEINYLTFRKDGTISYLPAGKECIYTDTGDWQKDGRQNGKPSKVIRKLLKERFSRYFKDSDYECFTNAYKSNFNEDGYKFEILENTCIKEVYDMERAGGGGSLNNSCMNGDSQFLDIYENCKKLKIVVLLNNTGQLCGRALLWKIDENINFIDRFYVAQDFMYDLFLSFAKENGYWYKKDYKSYDNKDKFIDNQGNEIVKEFSISTDTDQKYYPYIDTFSYGDDGFLYNFRGDSIYTYNQTDGDREDHDPHKGQVYCESTGEYIDEEDSIYIEEGERRYRYQYFHSDNCIEVDGNWYHEDDLNIVEVGNSWYLKNSDEICEIDGDYYLQDDCVYCDRDSQTYLYADCVYCEPDSEYILSCEAVKIDGYYYHEDSEKIIKIDGEYFIKEQ